MMGTLNSNMRHPLIVISDDIAFISQLNKYDSRNREILHFRLSELAFIHEALCSHFNGMICFDADTQYISENYSDFAIKWICSLFPNASVALLSSNPGINKAEKLSCYSKEMRASELFKLLDGKSEIHTRSRRSSGLYFPLSPQEKMVLLALAQGKTIREIAESSQRSVKTIYSQKSLGLKKLEVYKTELFSNLLGRFGYHQRKEMSNHRWSHDRSSKENA
ncbi:LuxR C-terminal-related transcriptional regulator [Buttiauxella sp. A2-C1_F]|uniref:LuxR C-terminal-related transcriptional regulator n=1 Tax=unclassified Buttiauxella TaxID=2634062 RepID=UPI001E52F0DE|nr:MULTISPECIES: LuxR C-terminal-related transcriptional regulator [unclassified Buttiauxella]MCE0798962.1 LuxR C-terminal-related transcriptional regulator [Buttiauxella sp. W03-F01]MCE0811555.1 LuxR C-terminal-related transcriptional regulator [Buttiauxella sp. S04-F03]MCE0844162.1 LuxR C-terminal-related transcriptional regulator [Buttiauxella sp. A2-C1_F]